MERVDFSVVCDSDDATLLEETFGQILEGIEVEVENGRINVRMGLM